MPVLVSTSPVPSILADRLWIWRLSQRDVHIDAFVGTQGHGPWPLITAGTTNQMCRWLSLFIVHVYLFFAQTHMVHTFTSRAASLYGASVLHSLGGYRFSSRSGFLQFCLFFLHGVHGCLDSLPIFLTLRFEASNFLVCL